MEELFTIENLIIYLITINLITLAAMYIDKRRARKSKWRIPENTLFILVFLGGRNRWNSWNVYV